MRSAHREYWSDLNNLIVAEAAFCASTWGSRSSRLKRLDVKILEFLVSQRNPLELLCWPLPKKLNQKFCFNT